MNSTNNNADSKQSFHFTAEFAVGLIIVLLYLIMEYTPLCLTGRHAFSLVASIGYAYLNLDFLGLSYYILMTLNLFGLCELISGVITGFTGDHKLPCILKNIGFFLEIIVLILSIVIFFQARKYSKLTHLHPRVITDYQIIVMLRGILGGLIIILFVISIIGNLSAYFRQKLRNCDDY